MTETPKRRWFQFRLGTWFILIGIVAWVMATPWEIWVDSRTLGLFAIPTRNDFFEVESSTSGGPPAGAILILVLNPALFWPAMAAVSFACWKLVWRIVERRRPAAQYSATPSAARLTPAHSGRDIAP